jgi:DNA topoisomerase-3
MRLFIAEKPSLAKAIADVLPGQRIPGGDGYIRVGDDYVTWCFGHMLELAEPKAYNPLWAKWDAAHLPYIIPAGQWKLDPKNDPGVRKQLTTIKMLLEQADCVVNAGDPDREGQMLIDELLERFGTAGKTVLRILLNATDPASARKALAKMSPNAKFRNLYEAAKCRSFADWLVGMNLTVAATKLVFNDQLVSIGRVQTVTLAMVVHRDLTIKSFVSKPFYNLEIIVQTAKGELTLTYAPQGENRLWDQEKAEALIEGLKGRTIPLHVESELVSERPPSLYTLTTFQSHASKTLKWRVAKSLEVLQQLYEQKLLSYPRTEIEYLPEEQKSDAISLGTQALNSLLGPGGTPFVPLLKPRDYIYNSAKVIEHHAIVVTERSPDLDGLNRDLAAAWRMVATRFIMSLLPDYRYQKTTASVEHNGVTFAISGKAPLNTEKSWRVLSSERQDATQLPPVSDGDTGQVLSVKAVKGKTTPPEPYTEGTLTEDMKNVAKFVTDERLKQILKDSKGIGTPATRANIIEVLKKRGFCVPEKDKLRSTEFGRAVVHHLPRQVKDPGLTAAWEDALDQIAEGRYSPSDFMLKIEGFVRSRLDDLRSLHGKVGAITPPPPARDARSSTEGGRKPRGPGRSTNGSEPRARTSRKEQSARPSASDSKLPL